jgi:predicted RNA-binding Zn-ribbon protein involved in translation (DUF1610 family)
MNQCKTCGEVLSKNHSFPCPKGDTTQKIRIAKRRAALNEAARKAGYPGWSAYETAILNSLAQIGRVKK